MLRELFALIVEASSYQWSGQLAIAHPTANLAWDLFFEMGQLVWLDGGSHPRRRCRRHYKALRIAPAVAEVDTDRARLQLTIAAIRAGRIDPDGLQRWLRSSAREVFFDISQACSSSLGRERHGHFTWHKNVRPSQEFILPASWGIDTCLAFKGGRRDWRHWKTTLLYRWSPDFAPEIVSATLLESMLPPTAHTRAVKLFSQGRTIRDIAARTQQHPHMVAASLLPLIRRRCVTLVPCPDYGKTVTPKALDYLSDISTVEDRATASAMPVMDEDPTILSCKAEASAIAEAPTIPPPAEDELPFVDEDPTAPGQGLLPKSEEECLTMIVGGAPTASMAISA